MDVNAVQHSEGSSQAVASPVVPAAAPAQVQATERIHLDIVEFSEGSQVKASETPLVENNNRNVRSGSHVFHDNAANRYVVQIVNENNEVIRQLPPEEALRIASRFRQVTGVIFDQST